MMLNNPTTDEHTALSNSLHPTFYCDIKHECAVHSEQIFKVQINCLKCNMHMMQHNL